MFTLKNIPLLTQREAIPLLFGNGEVDNSTHQMPMEDDYGYQPYFEPLPDEEKEHHDAYLLKNIKEDWYFTKLKIFCKGWLSPGFVGALFDDCGLVLYESTIYKAADDTQGYSFGKVGSIYTFVHISAMRGCAQQFEFTPIKKG